MKTKLLLSALAALTIGILGSCSKINERIDDIDSRVDSIEQEKIASIGQQIATINSSIADLETIRTNIQNLKNEQEAQGRDITALKAADITLEGKINDLKAYVDTELAKYATKDWANATFATLEQLETTEKALESLKETVDKLGDIDGALKNLKAELSDSIANAISSLAGRIKKLENAVDELKDKVDALEHRIQSVTIITAYNDGSVEADEDGILTINCIISPASAVTTLSEEHFTVLLNEVETKAATYKSLDVLSYEVTDKDAGEVKITANISRYTTLSSLDKALTAAVKVENGVSKFTTKFVGITCDVTVEQTVPSSAATFTLADNKKVRLIIEQRSSDLTLQYDSSSHYPENLEVQIKNGGTISAKLSGNLPFTHVDFTSGHIDHTSLTTSSSTLAVVTPATIGTLEVKGGNVVIKGAEVTTITVDKNAVADLVTMAPVQIVVEKYTPEPTEEDPTPEEKTPVVTNGITASANVIVAPAATVDVEVTTTDTSIQVANEGQGTVTDSSGEPIETKAAAQIGEATYITLKDALNTIPENNNQTVTIAILENIVLKASEALTINKNNVVLDGNGKTIALDENDDALSSYVASKYGQFKMITVSGKNVTLKNMTLDSKKYRGASLATTVGGENVVYDHITYEGKGCAHYYGTNGNGLITFKNCKINTCGYGVHSDTATSGIVIEDCEIHGWNAFGSAVTKVTINDSKFYGAEDSKNGTLAAFSIYCPTTFTNCTFSKEFHQKGTYEGLFMSAETLVSLNGCSVDEGELYNMVRIDDSYWPSGSVVAIDATGNATGGFTAGTFVAKQASDINVKSSYRAAAVDGKNYVYTVSVIPPAAMFNGQEYPSFEAALNAAKAAKGGKVTLVDDVTLTRTDYKGCSSTDEDFATRLYTIDLNGHKISGGLFAFEDCSYTIEDSVGGGSISRDGSCLQLNVSQYMASKMCTFSTCPTFTVMGGEFIGAGDLNNPYSCKYGVQIGAMGTYDNKQAVSKFLISGGTIRNMRIYNGKGEISGGAFEGQLKIEVCTESSDKYVSGVTYSDFVTTILGGIFNLADTNPIFGADYAKDRLGDHLQIKGGTFNFNPSTNYSACIPEGYTCQDNGNGTWTVVAGSEYFYSGGFDPPYKIAVSGKATCHPWLGDGPTRVGGGAA